MLRRAAAAVDASARTLYASSTRPAFAWARNAAASTSSDAPPSVHASGVANERVMRALGLTPDDFDFATPDADAEAAARAVRDKVYVDRRRVRAQAGAGGAGCVSFAMDGGSRRRRGADGGDGGRGGDVVFVACDRAKGLGEVKNLIRAERGKAGGSNGRIGRRGADFVTRVPVGTVVWFEDADGEEGGARAEADVDFSKWGSASPVDMHDDDEDDDDDDDDDARVNAPWSRPRGLRYGKWRILADLTKDGEKFVLARGGRGGRGNKHMPVGKEAGTREPGVPGEESSVVLELKSVADIGLVGLPNAGKSTLLRALSNATPRVASYAFTTLQPQLGAVATAHGAKITVADIPGLIKGAHENKGLGHNFLRHIERCETLAYVVDLSSADGVKPWDALEILRRELEEYLPGLSRRPALVVATKTDVANTARTLSALRKRVTDVPVLAVSALNKAGTDAVLDTLEKAIENRLEWDSRSVPRAGNSSSSD